MSESYGDLVELINNIAIELLNKYNDGFLSKDFCQRFANAFANETFENNAGAYDITKLKNALNNKVHLSSNNYKSIEAQLRSINNNMENLNNETFNRVKWVQNNLLSAKNPPKYIANNKRLTQNTKSTVQLNATGGFGSKVQSQITHEPPSYTMNNLNKELMKRLENINKSNGKTRKNQNKNNNNDDNLESLIAQLNINNNENSKNNNKPNTKPNNTNNTTIPNKQLNNQQTNYNNIITKINKLKNEMKNTFKNNKRNTTANVEAIVSNNVNAHNNVSINISNTTKKKSDLF